MVEFETCSRDLPHGGVFVPGLKLAELAECELVVRIPGRELALVARAVMVTPAGCGLELVGFGAEIRTKLADLATAALAATARKSTPPGIPTSRPPPPPPPAASASSPRIPTPATLTKPAPPLPVPRPTSASTPPPPPPPRSRPTTPPPAPPPPPPRASEDDEPEMTIERPEDDEPEMTIEPGDELSGKRDTRLQTAPMIAVPTVDEPELTTKPAAALDNADDDDANFARLFDDKPAATAQPAKEEPNFAEVPDEPPQDDGPTVTANPEELDDEPAMITEHRQEDTAITRLPHRHEDTAVTRHETTAVTRHEATAITPAPTGPDPDTGDGDSDDEERHEATAITTRPLGPDEHPLDPDEPTIMPSTFEPMALETGYRPPSRALRPEPSIPVSQWETNRWGHVDLDDNMPRTEIRDDKAALSLDAEPPDELLELTDAPAAAAAAAAAKPAPAGAGDASPAAGAKPSDAKPAAEPADAAGAAEAGEAADDDDGPRVRPRRSASLPRTSTSGCAASTSCSRSSWRTAARPTSESCSSASTARPSGRRCFATRASPAPRSRASREWARCRGR